MLQLPRECSPPSHLSAHLGTILYVMSAECPSVAFEPSTRPLSIQKPCASINLTRIIIVAGTHIQTGEEVGIKLVRTCLAPRATSHFPGNRSQQPFAFAQNVDVAQEFAMHAPSKHIESSSSAQKLRNSPLGARLIGDVVIVQESVKTKHPQLLYESKLYKILQGGSTPCAASPTRIVAILPFNVSRPWHSTLSFHLCKCFTVLLRCSSTNPAYGNRHHLRLETPPMVLTVLV